MTASGVSTINVGDHVIPGTADATSGITKACASAAWVAMIPDAYDGATPRPRRVSVAFTPGMWTVSGTITIPQGVDVEIQDGAYIMAIKLMGPVFDTASDVIHQDGRITCRGTIDCNNLATVGIYLRNFAHYEIELPRIYSPTQAGIIAGDPASATRSYEATIRGPYIWRPNAQAVPSGSIGIWMRNCTDSDIGGPGSVIVGCDIGVCNDHGNNTFAQIHPWGYPPNFANGHNANLGPTVGFLDNSTGASYIGCYADTPTVYGWHFTADNPCAQIIGGRFYLGSSGLDNIVVAVQISATVTGSVTCFGLLVQGSVSSRVAADYAGTLTGSKRYGTRNVNVVSTAGDAA